MRDPDQIEEEIARERAGLATSLKDLDAVLSPDRIVSQAVDALQNRGEPLLGAAKDNPLALALIGSGVAWLVAGASSNGHSAGPAAPVAYDTRPKPTATGLPEAGQDPTADFDTRVAAADQAMRHAETEGDDIMSMTATGATEYASEPETSSGFKTRMRDTAAGLRARLNDGLDKLPDAARDRILSARLAAIDAQAAAEAQMSRGTAAVRKRADGNPLLMGAVAFGIGAAIAAAIPRTQTENRTIGARRDALMDEAERMFREETAKLQAVAEAAVEEGKSAVKDSLRTGLPTEDDPAERIGTAAKSEAKKQGIGSVN